jgi:hypothetical protein
MKQLLEWSGNLRLFETFQKKFKHVPTMIDAFGVNGLLSIIGLEKLKQCSSFRVDLSGNVEKVSFDSKPNRPWSLIIAGLSEDSEQVREIVRNGMVRRAGG